MRDELVVKDCAAGCGTAHILRIGIDDGLLHARPPSIYDTTDEEQARFGLREFTYICPVLRIEVKSKALLPLDRSIIALARNLDDE